MGQLCFLQSESQNSRSQGDLLLRFFYHLYNLGCFLLNYLLLDYFLLDCLLLDCLLLDCLLLDYWLNCGLFDYGFGWLYDIFIVLSFSNGWQYSLRCHFFNQSFNHVFVLFLISFLDHISSFCIWLSICRQNCYDSAGKLATRTAHRCGDHLNLCVSQVILLLRQSFAPIPLNLNIFSCILVCKCFFNFADESSFLFGHREACLLCSFFGFFCIHFF